jgi:hypothetical protein
MAPSELCIARTPLRTAEAQRQAIRTQRGQQFGTAGSFPMTTVQRRRWRWVARVMGVHRQAGSTGPARHGSGWVHGANKLIAWRDAGSFSESQSKIKLCEERKVEGQDWGERQEACESRPCRSGGLRRESSGRPVLHRPSACSAEIRTRGWGRVASTGVRE